MQLINKPLADRLRPTKLSEVVGQERLTAKGKLLEQIVSRKLPVSLILWGPPGSGKTTLARIIANDLSLDFAELSAVSAKKKDVMQVIDLATSNYRLNRSTILFVDEIHRFNKAQQDAFLPYVEKGIISLIGATTENPSFEVIAALLSRCRVVVLKQLDAKAIIKILKRALSILMMTDETVPDKMLDLIVSLSGGDGRAALNLLELSLSLTNEKPLNKSTIAIAAEKQLPIHDKAGESHYNLISAYIKSLRGSDINASFYYLARMLQAGEDPKFIARRMIVFASEDIGLAAPAALNLAVSAFSAVERLGLPECRYNLFHCSAVLAKAPKSREVTDAMTKAELAAERYPNLSIPLHIRNAPTKLMRNIGYNQDYQWRADFKDARGYLPPEIKEIDFFND